jgi:hypothetical protein
MKARARKHTKPGGMLAPARGQSSIKRTYYEIATFVALCMLCCIVSGCNRKNHSEGRNEKQLYYEYPRIVDSLNVRGLYDSSMWFLYCFHSDLECESYLNGPLDTNLTFGQADLRLWSIEEKGDSVSFIYNFHYKDEYLTSKRHESGELSGLMYNKKNRKIIGRISNGWVWWDNPLDTTIKNPRLKRPLQKEVIQYIRTYRRNLHPKFYYLAVQKGLI